MALTEEQIKGLKPGDIIDIRGFVNLPLRNGNILVELRYEFDNRILPAYKTISTEFISLPGEPEEKPKYDPTRLFKKGDKVRVVECKGRNCSGLELGLIGEIALEEGEDDPIHGVGVDFDNGDAVYVDPAYLELVTPVEERMPYHIKKAAEFDAWFICNRNNDVIFHFNPDPCNQVMDMAEIEKLAREKCDYLNERFRDLIGKSAAEDGKEEE